MKNAYIHFLLTLLNFHFIPIVTIFEMNTLNYNFRVDRNNIKKVKKDNKLKEKFV